MDSMGYDQQHEHVFLKRNLDEVGMFDVVRETCKCGTQAVGQKRRAQVRVTHMLHGWKMFPTHLP